MKALEAGAEPQAAHFTDKLSVDPEVAAMTAEPPQPASAVEILPPESPRVAHALTFGAASAKPLR